jgi:hypothetical protein
MEKLFTMYALKKGKKFLRYDGTFSKNVGPDTLIFMTKKSAKEELESYESTFIEEISITYKWQV